MNTVDFIPSVDYDPNDPDELAAVQAASTRGRVRYGWWCEDEFEDAACW